MAARGQHVVPMGGKWSIMRSGAKRATAINLTKEDAIARATEIAQKKNGILYIHDEYGRVQERRTYCKHSHLSMA